MAPTGAHVNPPPDEGVSYREFAAAVTRHDGALVKLDTEKADASDVAMLSQRVDALRSALITFALSIAGSAIVFALGTLALLWQLGGH